MKKQMAMCSRNAKFSHALSSTCSSSVTAEDARNAVLTSVESLADIKQAIGALDAEGAVTITGDATVSNNKAGAAVGAIEALSLTIGGSATITGNEATKGVGAINTTDAVAVSGDAIVSNNKAGTSVGAISSDSLTIGGSATITGNEAVDSIGAIETTNAE